MNTCLVCIVQINDVHVDPTKALCELWICLKDLDKVVLLDVDDFREFCGLYVSS